MGPDLVESFSALMRDAAIAFEMIWSTAKHKSLGIEGDSGRDNGSFMLFCACDSVEI